MSKPPGSRILTHAVSTAVTIGVGMIPLHRLPRPVQTGYIVVPAAATSAIMLLAFQHYASRSSVARRADRITDEPSRGSSMSTVSQCALSLAFGGVVAGAGAASICLDRGIENLLRRRGVPAPRVMMGLASGALMLGVNALGDRVPSSPEDENAS
ncbi:hypothetical protein ACT3SQ_07070 [Brachybacterium sp. AOP42-C2-15]|uniref:hypothetical protein n=1 Tax=unclassified Brachybacterium TaxID=2623841 RepID=UPI003F9D4CC8